MPSLAAASPEARRPLSIDRGPGHRPPLPLSRCTPPEAHAGRNPPRAARRAPPSIAAHPPRRGDNPIRPLGPDGALSLSHHRRAGEGWRRRGRGRRRVACAAAATGTVSASPPFRDQEGGPRATASTRHSAHLADRQDKRALRLPADGSDARPPVQRVAGSSHGCGSVVAPPIRLHAALLPPAIARARSPSRRAAGKARRHGWSRGTPAAARGGRGREEAAGARVCPPCRPRERATRRSEDPVLFPVPSAITSWISVFFYVRPWLTKLCVTWF